MLSNIKAKHFISWNDLDFDIQSGIMLIDGWNEDDQRSEGSGKSAILNALSWGAFGCLPKEANVDDVIKDGETTCQVILEFDDGDSIVRSRKPNDLYLMKSGVMVKGKDARETQTLIEEYLGLNFETFCQSVYFAQNYDKKFLTAGQADKGKILSSIQNLQIFDKARKEVMDLATLEDRKITVLKGQVQVQENNVNNFKLQKTMVESFIEDKIKKHESQVDLLTQQRDLVSGHVLNTESQIESINHKILAIDLSALSNDEQELNEAKAQYGVQLANITFQKNQVDSITKSIQSKESEGKLIASRYENALNKKTAMTNAEIQPNYLRLVAKEKDIVNYNNGASYLRLSNQKVELEAFIANPTKDCPSCGTELKNVDTSHIQRELDAVIKHLEIEDTYASQEAKKNIQDKANYVIQYNKDLESIDLELQGLLDQLQQISTYLDQTQVPSVDALATQESEIRSVMTQINAALVETQQKKMEHSSLTNQYQSISNQYNNYVSQRDQLNQTISQLGAPDTAQDQQKLRDLITQIDTNEVQLAEVNNLLSEAIKYYRRLETLKDGFKEIKSYIFTNALNELNFRTNTYLNDLFEVEATIKFTNDDQKIESKIMLDGKERSLGLISGGQNRRFNLAVDLALSDIVSYRKTSKLDILIFDEYFKDLSEISMEKSLDLLKTRKCPVLLIEHNSIFKNAIDNSYFVRLQDGTSVHSKA